MKAIRDSKTDEGWESSLGLQGLNGLLAPLELEWVEAAAGASIGLFAEGNTKDGREGLFAAVGEDDGRDGDVTGREMYPLITCMYMQ